MAQRFDVSARLAEGRDAVAHTQAYVSACHRLGYRDPDLTGYEGQLADRYDSEVGLDLHVLDADCAALGALADAVEDILLRQCGQSAELAGAWRGPGAEAAAEFLRRHCAAGTELTRRLRAAALACGALRDTLWRLVDTKVAAVLAVDGRVGARGSGWLTAAHAVSSGTDDPHAVDIVEKQVMPYVDNDIRGEWAAAVRSAKDQAVAVYASAIAAADPGAGVLFAIPADLGPTTPLDGSGATGAVLVAPTSIPADVPPSTPAPDETFAPEPASADAPPAPAAPVGDTPTDPAPLPGMGLPGDLGLPTGGLPLGGGSGLGGLGGLGGLAPRLADALGDPGFEAPADAPAFVDDESEDPTDVEDAGDPETDTETEPAVAATALSEEPGEAIPADAATPDATPVAQEPGSGETDGDPAAEAASDQPTKTPCEIAAEELPQVGR
ncbi:hypothetical protein MU0083_003013 [[Mycobacterium] kokjensenii]|uniref:Uncharacterized protein n=1 Tax=[Mycobacterium] kokjensenii TaxID=3064287 RepID=A0ABN9N9M3_9MYCO|nr:hypothetical protein [Mycolicibacter sp. MU0083]CAJ1502759.1 hypothetical protein MU0083_003013 [Mycolicibacter sp. MU0083]